MFSGRDGILFFLKILPTTKYSGVHQTWLPVIYRIRFSFWEFTTKKILKTLLAPLYNRFEHRVELMFSNGGWGLIKVQNVEMTSRILEKVCPKTTPPPMKNFM